MQFFTELGSQINAEWKIHNYDERSFPEVACRCLAQKSAHLNVDMREILTWAVREDALPYQADIDAKFGDPPLTVFIGRKFRIDILFWTEGTPSIHQHSFSGAFQVLRGSSIHSVWDFQPKMRLELRLLLGYVSFKTAELLSAGDVRPIVAGCGLYHATYHLDRPTISIVARTILDADSQPQYTLLPPCIAFTNGIPSVTRQCQLLKMLISIGDMVGFMRLALEAVETKDAYTVFQILLTTLNLIEDDEQRTQLVAALKRAHPSLAEELISVLWLYKCSNRLLGLYRSTKDAELQFFLALLRNIPDGRSIRDCVAKRFPRKDPITLITIWIRRLSDLGLLGSPLSEDWHLMVLCQLMDLSEQQIQATFRSHSELGLLSEGDLLVLSAGVRNSWLLRPLFQSNARRCGSLPRNPSDCDNIGSNMPTTQQDPHENTVHS